LGTPLNDVFGGSRADSLAEKAVSHLSWSGDSNIAVRAVILPAIESFKAVIEFEMLI
jgi:hypothetical protein